MNNGTYIGRRNDASGEGSSAAAAPQEDDHAHEAALGFALHTDGPDRLGWLMNLNQARRRPLPPATCSGGCFSAECWGQACVNGLACSQQCLLCSACLTHPLTCLPFRLTPGLPRLQSQKVDKESGHAVSVVNCYFMCQVSTAQRSMAEGGCSSQTWRSVF
jgi:hypothetical protein